MTPFAQKLLDAQLLFQATFQQGVQSLRDGIDILWPMKAERVNAPGTEEVVFGFLAEMPLFRKWTGDRIAKPLKTGSYSLKVEDYEFTYKVGRDVVKYDKHGVVTPNMRAAGAASKRFFEDLLNDAQKNGKTLTGFDGQFFYDTDHPEGLDGTGSTFSNLNTTSDLTADNLAAKYAVMTQLKDANGKRFGVRPNILEYGPDLRAKAEKALGNNLVAEVIKNAAGNDNVGGAAIDNLNKRLGLQPLENPDLETGVWYLHDTRVMKPFIVVVETAPTGLQMRTDLNDPHVWDHKEFLFGAEATAAAGYGLPHLSQRNEV